MRISLRVVAVGALLTASAGHAAQQPSSTMQVQVNVVRSCVINSGSRQRPAGAVTVTCSGRQPGVVSSVDGMKATSQRVVALPTRETTVVAARPTRPGTQVVTINF
jgi:hypothetical protein